MLLSVQASGWPVINIVDFGADASGTNDSTRALQNALALAVNTPVLVPAGTYIVSDTLNVTSKTLMGAAHGSWNGDNTPLPTIIFQPHGATDGKPRSLVLLGGGEGFARVRIVSSESAIISDIFFAVECGKFLCTSQWGIVLLSVNTTPVFPVLTRFNTRLAPILVQVAASTD